MVKGVSKLIRNETKGHTGAFFGMSLDALGPSSIGNILLGEDVIRTLDGFIRNCKGSIRAGENFWCL